MLNIYYKLHIVINDSKFKIHKIHIHNSKDDGPKEKGNLVRFRSFWTRWTVMRKCGVKWKNEKTFFLVFIEPGHEYKSCRLTNPIKNWHVSKNGQNPLKFFKILRFWTGFTILGDFGKILTIFEILL